MQHAATEAPRYQAAREAGDFDIAAVIAGEGAGLVRDIAPAGAIVRDIVERAEALIAGGQGGQIDYGRQA
jgi:nitronate monooxygenase